MVGVENAVVPGTCAVGKIRIVADDVKRRFKDAVLPRHCVRGHEVNVANAVTADFVDKVVKGGGMSQVGNGIGLDAMAITTADEELVPLLRKELRLSVFLPAAEAIQLDCMDEVIAGGEELVDACQMTIRADLVEVPDGVVEDDEDLRLGVELGQDLIDAREGGRRSELREGAHPLLCGVGGKVVDADVEFGVAIGHGPLDRDRDLSGRVPGA